ncbi:MAG: hypothetical protein NC204_05095 [Candidatus Amulumruptor caecigallinarius]|nr:hypothetical protein [Candidatus Amulumruptor caecigallinarius]
MTADAEVWADSVLATMSVSRKAAQLFMPAVYSSSDFMTLRRIAEYADSCVGGILLLKGDVAGARQIADTMNAHGKVRPFVAIDAEWGLAMRLADAPGFPKNGEIADDVSDRLMFEYGCEMARECRLVGINMILGPVVDVYAPGGFMGFRTLGADPVRVGDLSVAYARGLESGNIISVAKHFPGHGSVTSDSHKQKGVIDRSLNEMDSVDLYPFRRWAEQKLSGVMVGHLAMPAIDSEMRPAAVSRTIITDLLRNDLGFSGLILTDAINMKGAEGYGSCDALKAGADIIIAPLNTAEEINAVVEAVKTGEISETELNSHVKRILFYKYLFGLNARESGNVKNKEKKSIGRGDGKLEIGSEVADSLSALLVDASN